MSNKIEKMISYMKPRIKSKKFWVSFFSLIAMAVKCFMGDDWVMPESYDTITNSILTILIAMGIVVNTDDTKKDNAKK